MNPVRGAIASLLPAVVLIGCWCGRVSGQDIRLPDRLEVQSESPLDRIRELEGSLLERPGDVDLIVLAAELYATAFLLETDPGQRRILAYRSREYANDALALDSANVEARYWSAAAAGMAAEVEEGGTKIRLVAEAWDGAGAVLEADPTHAGAHHLRGRINAGVRRTSAILRFIARTLLGAATVNQTSWEGAVHHLERAAALDPDVPLYHFDLAMVYEDLDRVPEMRTALERAIAAPGHTHPSLDAAHRRAAEEALAALREGGGG
jgi:tetratricopeptide (TPR) repeat protein